jgi:hypothetical protein
MEIELSREELDQINKGLRAVRDRHYTAYRNHKDPESETAQNNLRQYKELDELRFRLIKAWAYNSDLTRALEQV